jgi:hypothetical protein
MRKTKRKKKTTKKRKKKTYPLTTFAPHPQAHPHARSRTSESSKENRIGLGH